MRTRSTKGQAPTPGSPKDSDSRAAESTELNPITSTGAVGGRVPCPSLPALCTLDHGCNQVGFYVPKKNPDLIRESRKI